MPDTIRKAVAIQRDLIEGGLHEQKLHRLIARFAKANLYKAPAAATERLRREVMHELARKVLPMARQTGIASAGPLLETMAIEPVPVMGNVAKELSRKSRQTVELFVAKLDRDIAFHNASSRVAFIEARHNGVKRAQLVTDLVKADRASMKSITEALVDKDRAAAKLAEAEKRLAARPKSVKADKDVKEARKELKKAKRSVRNRASFLSRLETTIQGHARDAIRRECYDAQLASFEAAGFGVDTEYMWVAVNGSDACPSCDDLHGTLKTLSNWSGLDPGAGNTYCGSACMCQLIPASYTKDNEGLTQPITR